MTSTDRRRLLTDPIIVRRELDPAAIAELRRDVRRRDRTAVLPGVFLPVAVAGDPLWRAAAATRWRQDAVVWGELAAQLTFWPELSPQLVQVATRTTVRRPGYRFSDRQVPPELTRTVQKVRITDPCLTTVDLIGTHGTDVIDRALRSRQVSLDGLWSALRATAHRRGNRERSRALIDSRGEPWSAAERLAHRRFRETGLTGWITNHPVRWRGLRYFIDIAFVRQKLAIEIDGRLHEDDPNIFENDRWRQNALVAGGWTVLRFTWQMLVEHFDECLAAIRQMLRRLAA